jgi:hypothetical protein
LREVEAKVEVMERRAVAESMGRRLEEETGDPWTRLV